MTQTVAEMREHARVTLHDHWPEMKQHDFIKNRAFDALACGLQVISDHHSSLESLFPHEVLCDLNHEELVECFERCLLSHPPTEEAACPAMDRVYRKFSFAERTRRLLGLATDLLAWAELSRLEQHNSRS